MLPLLLSDRNKMSDASDRSFFFFYIKYHSEEREKDKRRAHESSHSGSTHKVVSVLSNTKTYLWLSFFLHHKYSIIFFKPMLLYLCLVGEKVVILCLIFWYLKIIDAIPEQKGIVTSVGAYLMYVSLEILISELPQ